MLSRGSISTARYFQKWYRYHPFLQPAQYLVVVVYILFTMVDQVPCVDLAALKPLLDKLVGTAPTEEQEQEPVLVQPRHVADDTWEAFMEMHKVWRRYEEDIKTFSDIYKQCLQIIDNKTTSPLEKLFDRKKAIQDF